jgi:hypothetical protein
MRTRERKRPDRRWRPWSTTGLAAGRSLSIKQQPLVESLEARNLLSLPQGAHFIGEPTCTVAPNQDVTVSGAVGGLGNTNIFVKLSAEFTFEVQCQNKGGHVVEVHTQTVTQTVTSDVLHPENGRADFNVTLEAPTPEEVAALATCPNPNWTPLPGAPTLLNNQVTLTVTSADGTGTAPDLTSTLTCTPT